MRSMIAALAILASSSFAAEASTPMSVDFPDMPVKTVKHHHHRHHYYGSIALAPRHHRHHYDGPIELALFHPPTSHPQPGAPVRPAPAPVSGPDPALTIVQQLQATLPHWQAADAVAVGADPDHPANIQAHSCFAAVVQFLEGFAGPGGGPAPADSPIVAYARSTVLHAQIQPGLPAAIKVACAPLVDSDDASFLSRLMAMDGLTLSQSDLAKAGF